MHAAHNILLAIQSARLWALLAAKPHTHTSRTFRHMGKRSGTAGRQGPQLYLHTVPPSLPLGTTPPQSSGPHSSQSPSTLCTFLSFCPCSSDPDLARSRDLVLALPLAAPMMPVPPSDTASLESMDESSRPLCLDMAEPAAVNAYGRPLPAVVAPA